MKIKHGFRPALKMMKYVNKTVTSGCTIRPGVLPVRNMEEP
ncbi:hypothetical protein [Dysgonomonas termitidis]